MSVTLGTKRLHAAHPVAHIFFRADRIFIYWSVKTGPAGSRFELGAGIKQRSSAAHTGVGSGVMLIPIFASKSRFGPFLTGHMELFRRELFFPFGVSFFDLCHG